MLIETSIVLFISALTALPGLISDKREAGRAFLRNIMIPQGLLGLALVVIALVALAGGVLGETAGERGSLPWLILLVSHLSVLVAGLMSSLFLALALAVRRRSAEVRARADKKHRLLSGFQAAVGFLCLLEGAWCLLAAVAFVPLLSA
jgi:hypothetical protein